MTKSKISSLLLVFRDSFVAKLPKFIIAKLPALTEFLIELIVEVNSFIISCLKAEELVSGIPDQGSAHEISFPFLVTALAFLSHENIFKCDCRNWNAHISRAGGSELTAICLPIVTKTKQISQLICTRFDILVELIPKLQSKYWSQLAA